MSNTKQNTQPLTQTNYQESPHHRWCLWCTCSSPRSVLNATRNQWICENCKKPVNITNTAKTDERYSELDLNTEIHVQLTEYGSRILLKRDREYKAAGILNDVPLFTEIDAGWYACRLWQLFDVFPSEVRLVAKAFDSVVRVPKKVSGKLSDAEQMKDYISEVERIANDYIPDNDSQAPTTLAEMREALQTLILKRKDIISINPHA